MRIRDFFRLPLGNHKLTDGVYTFLLKKEYNKNLSTMTYSIREYRNIFGGSVTFYEEWDDVFDNSSKYKKKMLTYRVFITGMSFGGTEGIYNIICNLKYIPNSSYKEWLKKVEVLIN